MTAAQKELRIGVGAGFAGDRCEAAEALAHHGELDALVFETLAERTIALAQLDLHQGTGLGYDPRLLWRIAGTWEPVLGRGGVIVTNGGAADPLGAARAIRRLTKEAQATHHPNIVAVLGDDVRADLDLKNSRILGTDQVLAEYGDRIISANAYTGAEAIQTAISSGADIVVTGRTSDPALFLGPVASRLGWDPAANDDLNAAGLLAGHLLECGGQLTGGYFADGGRKAVPNLAFLGFPMAEISDRGGITISKLPGTGGLVSAETVIEQLLYEIEDPGAYVTPDGILDLRSGHVDEIAPDVVRVGGARLAGRPQQLKVSVGVSDGFRAAASIIYAGQHALRRARLAGEIIAERWSTLYGYDSSDLAIEYVGVNSTRHWWDVDGAENAPEVRLRIGLRSLEKPPAVTLCEEVEALYTNGPAGGGGVTTQIAPSVGIVSTLIPKDLVQQRTEEV